MGIPIVYYNQDKERGTQNMKKEFTYTLVVKDPNGGIINKNVADKRKGYGKSCFSTEESTRKHLKAEIRLAENFAGQTVISWEIWKGCTVIDKFYKAN